jgi:uncharacterized membrane protein
VILAAVSVHVRRFLNGAAMFVACAVVWMFMFVAMPLESPNRVWRLAGLGGLAAAVASCWPIAELASARSSTCRDHQDGPS